MKECFWVPAAFMGAGVCHAFEVVPTRFPSHQVLYPLKSASSMKWESKVKRGPHLGDQKS